MTGQPFGNWMSPLSCENMERDLFSRTMIVGASSLLLRMETGPVVEMLCSVPNEMNRV
jgi:hypothetical protein